MRGAYMSSELGPIPDTPNSHNLRILDVASAGVQLLARTGNAISMSDLKDRDRERSEVRSEIRS
eukprot:8072280-Alexandrium_andersonii.AAC.1